MNDQLFDEAKLTDEELDALENEHLLWDDDSTRPIADAATAKALRVVLERVRGVAVCLLAEAPHA